MRKYKLSENFFKKINTEEKAYFLGFMYADGSIQKNEKYKNTYSIQISLQKGDKDILEKFKISLKTDRPLYYIQKSLENKNWNDIYRLHISNAELAKDLIKLGCTFNKSLTLKFPTKNQIPNHLIHHFIRGYFDGDGCIWEGKRYKTIIKDKNHKLGKREKIIHNVKFTITGTEDFIKKLQEILLIRANINISKLSIRFKERDNVIRTLEQSGRGNIKKLYDFIYKNSTIYLNRKKEKFESINKRANI